MLDPLAPTEFAALYKRNLIPLYVVLCSLVWVLHDYFVTLEDEVTYIWTQRRNFGKFMFFWIRYYTIILLIFDVVQIHSFTIPGFRTHPLCLASHPTIRFVGAISLWSVEIIMQLRIYALFNRSKKVALFNGILFLISVGLFLWILIVNSYSRKAVIAPFAKVPLIGCPVVSGGDQWSIWVPATVYEFVLFGFALYKAATSSTAGIKLNNRPSLTAVLLLQNILYFLIIGCILIFNILMVVGTTQIPWFGFGPFHASMGIATSRMLIHLRKFSSKALEGESDTSPQEIRFIGPAPIMARPDLLESFDADDSSRHDVESIAGSSIHSHSLSDHGMNMVGSSSLGVN
jgi:hypothetical protein